MATMMNTVKVNANRKYVVIHPLDDVAEEKCSVDGLGQMHMTKSVKLSLYTLRGYLITMVLLVGYRLITLAGSMAHPH